MNRIFPGMLWLDIATTPLDRIAGIAERLPIHQTIVGVAILALQRIFFGLHHARRWLVHPGFGKAKLAAELKPVGLRAHRQRRRPVEGRPEAALAGGGGREQIVVDRVVGLFGAVHLERPDARIRVVEPPLGGLSSVGPSAASWSPMR